MIFISTCSQDSTTDIVVRELDANDVMRFNIDKPNDFAWDFHAHGFRIADKVTGKEISEKTLTSFYLRKPMYFDLIDVPKYGCVENWRREETDELFNDFFRECQNRGLVARSTKRTNTASFQWSQTRSSPKTRRTGRLPSGMVIYEWGYEI